MLMKNVVTPIVAAIAAALAARYGTGCGMSTMEQSYIMEITGCVERAKTKQEADECRRDVNRRYGLCNPADWPRVNPCD